jgi:pilus assembly protein CpaB
MIPIALSLVVATTAGILLYKWLQTQKTPKEMVKVESEAVPVAVAAVDLAWGTKLEPEMIETAPYLKESLPPGYASDPKSLQGRVVISPLKPNEPILESRLAPISVTTGGVSAIIKPGKRALAVKGNKVIGISGFIRPANRVDVLVTLTDPKTNSGMSKTVLEDILVLATGTQIENNRRGKPHPVDVYTLEVTPVEGERLALAAAQGKLQFALRNVIDKEGVLTKGATVRGTLASLRPKRPPRKRRARQATPTVEVITGDIDGIRKLTF